MDSAIAERARHPDLESKKKAFRALALSFIFIIASGLFLIAFFEAWQSKPLSEGWQAIKASPYGLSALADYIVGAVFGAMLVYFRDGPPLLCISATGYAIASPFVGSFVPVLYMAYLLILYKSIRKTFTPKSAEIVSEPLYDPPANRRQTLFIASLFSGLLIFFLGVCLYAVTAQSLNDGIEDFRREKWISVTFQDNLLGLLLTSSFVVVREGGFSFSVLLWLLAFALLGNAPTCVYVIRIALQSLQKDISFPVLLLSQR